MNLKATQGYMSPPMKKFSWLKSFYLKELHDKKDPLVVFGCYKLVDHHVVLNHKGLVIIVWMGTDTHKIREKLHRLVKPNVIHTTWLPAVQKYLISKGVDCKLLKMPIKEYPRPIPVTLGNKVYAYLAKGKPEYHGSKIVESLRIKQQLLIGNDSIRNSDWYNGESNKFYSQAFIGLALSSYVGGAMTIQEMAVRGIRVVTNVLTLPNCIPWKDKSDVERIIRVEASKINQSNNGLVKEVYSEMAEVKGCFDLSKLLV